MGDLPLLDGPAATTPIFGRISRLPGALHRRLVVRIFLLLLIRSRKRNCLHERYLTRKTMLPCVLSLPQPYMVAFH